MEILITGGAYGDYRMQVNEETFNSEFIAEYILGTINSEGEMGIIKEIYGPRQDGDIPIYPLKCICVNPDDWTIEKPFRVSKDHVVLFMKDKPS